MPSEVRLDSLDPARGGRSFRFAGPVRTLRADAVAGVAGILAEVEAAVAAGRHAVGYVAYDAAPAFDPALVTRPPREGLPLAWFRLFEDRIEAPEPDATGTFELGPWAADVAEPEYRAAFARIRDLLAGGDTYQVNLTFRLRAPFSGDPRALYARLCAAQRSAFCAYLDIGTHAIVSASPELFFAWRDGRLTLRPMKGTRPRGRWAQEDDALAAELLASPKERSENLMIVDLLRNDAGRVAVPGSVEVARLFEVEGYDTVHQMTSTIHADTRQGTSLGDLFRALFPCGSVTGAPKVRTLEIIAETEISPRGVYCGAIGFVSPDEAAFSVAIRTVVVDRASGSAELGVGSGVTWDAEPGAEYRECLAKAAFTSPAPADFDLLETLLFEPGRGFFLLDRHLRRLEESSRRLGFRFDRRAVLRVLHESAAGAARPRRVRLVLPRDGVAEASVADFDPGPPAVRVSVSDDPVLSSDRLLFHKTTHREPYESRRARHPGRDDVLLTNERGELTESTIANLVVKLEGGLWTPPLDSGLLPGVLRAELLERGEVAERVLRPEDLARAESVWLVSSVRRWRRAVLDALA